MHAKHGRKYARIPMYGGGGGAQFIKQKGTRPSSRQKKPLANLGQWFQYRFMI